MPSSSKPFIQNLDAKNQCCGSGMFSWVPDPGSTDFGSASMNLSKTVSEKWSCMFIPDPDFFPSLIPDPGVKKAPDHESRIPIRNTVKYKGLVRGIFLFFWANERDSSDCCLGTTKNPIFFWNSKNKNIYIYLYIYLKMLRYTVTLKTFHKMGPEPRLNSL
jgi:hypothetical protein